MKLKKKSSSKQFNADQIQLLKVVHFQNQVKIKSEDQFIVDNIVDDQVDKDLFQQMEDIQSYDKKKSSSIMSLESEQQQSHFEMKRIQEQIKQQNMAALIQKKMAIGGGFSLDMSDFFKFKKQKKLELQKQSELFGSLMTSGHLAWIILFYFVCNSAIMPAWIMSIKANKILRISWRFLLQSILMIPFVLYEKRTGSQSVKSKYKFNYIFTLEGLRKVYISSIGTSIWFAIILSCFQWTYISHSIVLGSLSNFFLSLSRSLNYSTHQLQPGGQIFVVIGILFVVFDSYTLEVQELPRSTWKVINTFYLTRQPIGRVIGDLAALSGAFIISRFSQMSVDLKTYYPPFLSMFLVNVSVSFHVGLSAYYINGATFDRDTNYGMWGLFTDIHFGGFFYMAVIVSMGMFLSFTMISKLFTDPIIPALAMTLQPFFATFFLNLVSVQTMPGSFSIYGFLFVICGIFLILIGQFLLQKHQQRQQKKQQFQKQLKQKLLYDKGLKNQTIMEDKNQQIESDEQYKIKISNNKRNQRKSRHGKSEIVHD